MFIGFCSRHVSHVVARLAILLCGLLGGLPLASAQTQTAVEYYYADWNHYFVTWFLDEIAVLDAGAFGGAWKRTGQTFTVWSDGAQNGALPTCRFFSTSFAPKSSHLYTPYAAECEGLKSNPNWQFESIAFYLRLPDVNGNCPGAAILYRLYNNGMGGAPNHRYTTDPATFSQMIAAGWVFEGDGRTGAFACVPQSTPSSAEGLWGAVTDAGALLRGVVLDDGTFYFLYTTQSSYDFVQGTSTSVNGQFQETDAGATTFGVGVSEAAVRATYVPRNFLDGYILFGGGGPSPIVNDTFRAFYSPAYEQPASLSAAAGTYAGVAGSSVIKDTAMFALDASGALSGTAADCTFTGIAAPRGNVNIFNVSVTFQGGACALGTSTVIGVIYYDAASAEILLLTVNAADGFAVVGSKQ